MEGKKSQLVGAGSVKDASVADLGNKRTEAVLAEYDLVGERTVINLSEIDMEKSLKSQSRAGEQLDADLVDTYAIQMLDGDVFPAIVVTKTNTNPKTKYLILGGLHRAAAAEAASKKKIEAFVVKGTTERQRVLVMMKLNEGQGKTLSKEDRIQQARYLISLGWSLRDAAAECSISHKLVSRSLAIDETRSRIAEMRIRGADKILASNLARMASVKSDVILRILASMVVKYEVGVVDLNDLIVAVNKKRSEKEQKAFLEAYEKTLAESPGNLRASRTGTAAQVPKPVSTMRRLTRGLANFDPDSLVEVPKDLKPEMESRIDAAILHLEKLKANL